MIDYYSHTNQKIMIGHFPGNTKKDEAKILKELSKRKFHKPDNIDLVCPFSKDSRDSAILIDQLENNGYYYYNSLRSRDLIWERELKPCHILSSLEMCKNEYALILDTNDVAILTDLDDIFNRFNDYKEEFPNLKILYNATIWIFPHMIIDNVKDRYKYGDFSWLNAGCCFGKVDYMKEFYKEICDKIIMDRNTHSGVSSEQYYVRKIFDKHQDKVFFDYKCSIFQCWHKQEYRYDGDKCYLL